MKNQINDRQNEAPKFFKFSGIISEMTTNAKDKMPKAPASKMNAKEAIGIQFWASTSYSIDFNSMYTPRTT